MRIVCAAFILAVGCVSTPAADSRAQILRNEKEITDAWLRHDVGAVSKYFADDFTEVTRSGRILKKSDILAAVASNDETETLVTDEVVTQHGRCIAIQTARIIDKGRKASGEPYAIETRVMNVWILRRGEWRIVASQSTFVTPGT